MAEDAGSNSTSHPELSTVLARAVEALAEAIEQRDAYANGHQARVARIATGIGQVMDLGHDRLRGLELSALLHDVGKVSIPADLLMHPARLGEQEYGVIKTHPERGYAILKEIPFPWPVAETVHQHHERLDGSGYPRGLKDEDVLLESRILAVADVLEAMTAHRSHRPCPGLEAARAELQQNRGSLFDPAVVDACMEVIDRGGPV